MPIDRYDYTDFMRGNRESAVVSLMSYVTMLIVRKNKKCFCFLDLGHFCNILCLSYQYS